MNGFTISIPPLSTFAYKLAELAAVYLGLDREPDRFVVTDLTAFKDRLRQVVETARDMRVRIQFTGNDNRYFVSSYSDWLRLNKYSSPLDLLSKYAETVDTLVNDRRLFSPPSILKINFYEYERRMGLKDSKAELRLNGHQIALCLAGAHIALTNRVGDNIAVFLLLPRTPSLIVLKEGERLRRTHERLREALRHVIRGKEIPPTSVMLLYLSASLILKGDVHDDGVFGSMALVQESGNRASILSVDDITTHGLVRLLRDNERRAASACLTLIDAYLDVRSRNMGSDFVRLIEGSSSNLLVYSISGSLDALYNAVSGFDRLARLLRDPQTVSKLRMKAENASWVARSADILSAHLAETYKVSI